MLFRSGKSDSGSTGISSQIMTWLVGPCTQDDANEIFSPELRRAGWTPHLLNPAVRGKAANDAGRCFVSAAGFGPDVYSSWRPMPEEETKRRRRRRLDDGIPQLAMNPHTVEGKVVPRLLSALAAAFDELEPPDGRLPSSMAAEWISHHTDLALTATQLAGELRKELGSIAPATKSGRNKLGGNCAYYLGADIEAAMGAL